ncbi:GTA-gp10 family protein [Pseudophaeobacter flagellatus]|uniref:GTA-gp10 family protein n=1 Tax=Pseudophaeobacter flagellatus TaxID=2899119 RepID=UPI001E4E5D7C|nr:GTA-gp10 family protein [Pseudophaeobacter flagellatus]MCD9148991.1 hypothetical protein [Pseudophaeobacter flagellatus]
MANRFMGETTAQADGNNWTLRCDFNAMAAFEEATGKDAMTAFEAAEQGDVSVLDLRHLVRACLLRHHPDATLCDAGDVLSHDIGVVERLIAASMPTAGEAAELGNGQALAAPETKPG